MLESTVEALFNAVVGGHTSHPRYSLTAVYKKITIERRKSTTRGTHITNAQQQPIIKYHMYI